MLYIIEIMQDPSDLESPKRYAIIKTGHKRADIVDDNYISRDMAQHAWPEAK